jgi:HK97 family phage prohead protease
MMIECLASDFDVDSEGFRFARGAWSSGLVELKGRGTRDLPLLFDHWGTVGRVPLASVREEARGLVVTCELDDATPLQREARDQVRRGTLRGISVGYYAREQRQVGAVREIHRARLHHVALTPEPRNPRARILRVVEESRATRDARDLSRAVRELRQALREDAA